jgi:hypothetical protein
MTADVAERKLNCAVVTADTSGPQPESWGSLLEGAGLATVAGFSVSIERDTDPPRLSPDNVTMVIAVLCVDNQVE